MSDFAAWVGECHLRSLEGGEEYHAQAAVWADSAESFRDRLAAYVTQLGYQILWAEECLPALEYLRRHSGQQSRIGTLARAVHEQHLVELSKLVVVGAAGEPEPESSLTITEHAFEPLADQTGIPFWDQEWIAPELKDLLFGQSDGGPPLRTYFIVDATLRKNITGFFDLDSLDVPIQCLFKEDAAEELKETAPYLIDMTLPDGAWDDRDLVPSFHKDFFKKHWGQNTGVFIRTGDLFADVWTYYRKFTRVQMEDDGRWVLFRFWDPRTVSAFVEALGEDDLHKFLGSHRLINPAQTTLKRYEVTSPIGENQRRALPPLIIKNNYIKAFGSDRGSKIKYKIQDYIEQQSSAFEALPGEDKSRILDTLIGQALQYGIKIEKAVADFVLASIYFGQALATDPQFERIIKSHNHQIDKGKALLREVQFRLNPR